MELTGLNIGVILAALRGEQRKWEPGTLEHQQVTETLNKLLNLNVFVDYTLQEK